MRMAISLYLNILLILAYGVGIVYSCRLAVYTPDKTARKVRILTAVINVGMFLLSAALLLVRFDMSDYLSGFIPTSSDIVGLTDLAVLVNIVAVSLQLANARGKIRNLTWVYLERDFLRREANLDPLTGLLNRRALTEAIDKCGWNKWCVILIDIDDFKLYNDNYGHLQGDQLLKSISDCIKGNIRSWDYAFRYGGEEIAVLCPDAGIDEGRRIADHLCGSIRQLKGTASDVTASVGIGFSGHDADIMKTIARADVALYEAKKQGKNRVVAFEQSAV